MAKNPFKIDEDDPFAKARDKFKRESFFDDEDTGDDIDKARERLQRAAANYVRHVDKADSVVEEMFWATHQKLQFPELGGLQRQVPVMGGLYLLDFALPRPMIAFEIDGYEWHSGKTAFVNDRIRWRNISRSNWIIVHFAGQEVHDSPEGCVRQAATIVHELNQA